MTKQKRHILILPRWYPNKTDIQLGIFIKNQALLLKNDFEISVIYVQSDSNINEKYEINEQKKEGIHEQIVYFKKSTSLFKKLINFRRYKKAQQLAFKNLENKVDLCHVHVPIRSSFLAIQLLKEKQIPFVITEHWSGHLTGEFAEKSNFYKSHYKNILQKAKRVSCVSEFLKEKFIINTGYTPIVTPNYIEKHDLFENQPQSEDKINVLSVNDFIDNIKNITGLVKAFKLAVEINPKLHLTLVGGGPDEHQINKLISDLEINPNQIKLLGRLKHAEVLQQMAQCDFYVSNSNFETFGMTIAEALLSGKPVISTLSGGPNEFLKGSNSISISIKQPDQLKLAILKMADSYQEYNAPEISLNIESQYGKKVILENLKNFYTV